MGPPDDAHAASAQYVVQLVAAGDHAPGAPVGLLIRNAGQHRFLTSLSLPPSDRAPRGPHRGDTGRPGHEQIRAEEKDGGNNTDTGGWFCSNRGTPE
ncbi:hypothetical protein TPA0905_54860 [Streptomyces olivaceus]|nr:hypothetical protein TPA0905_54860 [Streptomyces olivaceus]